MSLLAAGAAANDITAPRLRSNAKRRRRSLDSFLAEPYLTTAKVADLDVRLGRLWTQVPALSPPPPPLTRSSSVGSDVTLRTPDDSEDDGEDGLGWLRLSLPRPAVAHAHAQDRGGVDDRDGNNERASEYEYRHGFGYATLPAEDAEFGHCDNEAYRYTSAHRASHGGALREAEPPYYIIYTTYFSYLLLFVLGHVRDFFGKRFRKARYMHLMSQKGYAPLTSDFDSFFTRRVKARINDCFSLPVTGVPGRTITLIDRHSPDHNRTFVLPGTYTRALNISSYNYLGFAAARGACADAVATCITRNGVSAGGPRLCGGTTDLHSAAEALVARFVGREAALVCAMGFATNSTLIPALVGPGCLVLSDVLNHASIRAGVRVSGAVVRAFRHNDMRDLERMVRAAISQGQPRTHRAWRKIMVAVEGLYSMEGTMADLPALLRLKKRYKFNLFVDEAHSIGALGPHGRGICDYYGVDPRSVDILMGTFTKSFGASGGYIAASRKIVDRLRLRGHSGAYAESMTLPVLTQIIASMASIMGVAPPLPSSGTSPAGISSAGVEGSISAHAHPGPVPAALLPPWLRLPRALLDGSEGRTRLRRLAFNARYLSRALVKLGFITCGHEDAPIVPLLLFNVGKLPVFHRLMRARRTPIVVVTVGYPATPLVAARVRFCVSAAHTKEDIDTVLTAVEEIGGMLDLKHGIPRAERWSLGRVIEHAVELVQADSV